MTSKKILVAIIFIYGCKLVPTPPTNYNSNLTFSFDKEGEITQEYHQHRLFISEKEFLVIDRDSGDTTSYEIYSRLGNTIFLADGYVLTYNRIEGFVHILQWRHGNTYHYKHYDQLKEIPYLTGN